MIESFHFLRPLWLFAIPAAIPLLWITWRRSGAGTDWSQVCDPHLLPHLVAGRDSARAPWPLALLTLGCVFTSLALAGPTWERLPQLSYTHVGRTVLVVGLAPSMNARDIAPSRIARARHKMRDVVDALDGASVALVLYREEAFSAVPLTEDIAVLRELIPLVESDLAPGRAVFPARGLREALHLLEPVGAAGARVILVTDGSDDDPSATREAASAVAGAGARLSVLSLTGDNANLEALAQAGNGSFAALSADDSDLDKLLVADAADAQGHRVKATVQADAWRDMGAWLVWVPLLLAPIAFRKGWVTAFLLVVALQFPTVPANAGVRDWFERPDQQATRAFEAGDYATSADTFEDPAWKAAAHFRAGDYETAADLLKNRPDPQSQYNRGNALAKAGRLDEAIAAYEAALSAEPNHTDAAFNRDLVQKLLDNETPPPSADAASSDASDASGKATSSQGESGDDEGTSGSEKHAQADVQPDFQPEANNNDANRSESSSASSGESVADARESQTSETPTGAPAQPANPASPSDSAPAPDASSAREASSRPVGDPSANQWMARLPDDPGGLLREKMRRDYVRKVQARQQGERR